MNSKPVVCGQRSLKFRGRKGWPISPAAALLHVFVMMVFYLPPVLAGEPTTLQDIEYSSLPGNKVQITLTASDMLGEPTSFSTDNPARIALDFAGVKSGLKQKTQAIGVGVVRSVTAVEAGGRTRVVINLVASSAHEVSVEGNKATVIVEGGSATSAVVAKSQPSKSLKKMPVGRAVQNIDFRRGESGEGRVIITLSDPATLVDMREEGGRIVLDFLDASLPHELMRKYDVTDFATPVQSIVASLEENNARMVIVPAGDYEHLAYQADNLYTVEFRPLTKQEQEQIRKEKRVYTGERLSLNFQDIEVRAVLQLLADFTGLNMVTSDTVGGRLTLRLKNVPWDQALDIILKTKGLSMRRTDNVVLVAPTEEIAAREKLELESEKQIEELAPLYSEFIQINYAKAADLAALIKSGAGEGETANNLMSERGSVTIDERTNTLLIQDTAAKLEDIRRLVTRLDVPVRQVLIESRIVIANDDFAKDLGVRFGFARPQYVGGHDVYMEGGVTGYLDGTDAIDVGSALGADNASITNGSKRNLLVNLPAPAPSGAINFLIGRLGSYLLQLELSAMQTEGKGEVISSPRVITSDQNKAVITQGFEIPYSTASDSGTNTEFKKAELKLEVTPNITPDDRVEMELLITKDQPVGSEGALETRSLETNVLVNNGETVVLGGVYEKTKTNDVERVPLFGDLPYVGFLFKNDINKDLNKELLVFVTPKVLKENMTLR